MQAVNVNRKRAHVDVAHLRASQAVHRIVVAYDHGDTVHGDGHGGKTSFNLGILQRTGRHTDIAHAVAG